MLNREQQRLLEAADTGLTASGLLDEVRQRTTCEGGRSVKNHGWISYNRKAIWLEDHSAFAAALRAAGTDHAALPRFKPVVLVKATWAEVAAHGAALPASLRAELVELRNTQAVEERAWNDFSNARGGWPHRRRFATDAEHTAARAEWDPAYLKHVAALRAAWDRQKQLVARALPLLNDDEPMDLLELLDQTTAPTPSPSAPSLQAAALRPTPAQSPKSAPDEGLFAPPAPGPALRP